MTDATIEQQEALSVASLISLSAIVRSNGLPRSLLFAQVNFGAYQGEARPRGAPAPDVARSSYTRQARRVQRQRQLSRRSGLVGLQRSLRAL